jgi:hypothetical protein
VSRHGQGRSEVVHRIGCAALERRAQCTCGAEGAFPWGWFLLGLVVVLGVVGVWWWTW